MLLQGCGIETDLRSPPGDTIMNRPFLHAVNCLSLASLVIAPAFSQSATTIVGDDLSALVNGRSWGISYYGDPTNPALTMVWDFRTDGSVCARSPGGKKGDKCMDEGKWALKGEVLCWELTWMGQAGDFKSNCFSVKKIGNEQFQMNRQKEPDTKFAVFRVL
jgi:hypothetical protein